MWVFSKRRMFGGHRNRSLCPVREIEIVKREVINVIGDTIYENRLIEKKKEGY